MMFVNIAKIYSELVQSNISESKIPHFEQKEPEAYIFHLIMYFH